MRSALASLCVLLFSGVATAQSGFVELRASWQVGVEGKAWQLVERFRPRFTAELDERWAIFSELEVSLQQGRRLESELRRTLEASELGPILESAGYVWPEDENETLGVSRLEDYLEVSRLYLDWYHPDFDLRVGRQSIYWGSAAFLNPTDPFPELLIAEPWRPRRGMNAARLNLPLSERADLTLVTGSNDSFKALRAASRLRATFGEADFSLVAAYRGDDKDGLIGLDLRGTYGVGYWIESALWSTDWKTFDLAIGFDYSIHGIFEGIIVMGQFLYNGRGIKDVAGLTLPASSPISELDATTSVEGDAMPTFGPILRGRYYAMGSMTLALSLDLSLGITKLMNLEDRTGFVVPNLSYRASDWLELFLTAQIPWQLSEEGGEFYPSDESMTVVVPLGGDGTGPEVDLSGLRPDASVTLWCRMSY